jgi:hypothetical protein
MSRFTWLVVGVRDEENIRVPLNSQVPDLGILSIIHLENGFKSLYPGVQMRR